MPILDWKSRHDPKSRSYAIRELVPATTIKTKLWREGTVLDQGAEGACVGFGWTGNMLAYPVGRVVPEAKGNSYAIQVYKEAQKIDQWTGEDYEGTSVLAGAQVLRSRGLIESYRWAFSIEDVRDAIITTGPVVIGIPWYEGMYDTSPSGLVDVTGRLVGGHCILLTGFYKSVRIDGKTLYNVFRWRNSWGLAYGRRGSGFITMEDLARLLADDGEACVPLGKKRLVLA